MCNLRMLREARVWTQVDLAEKSGVGVATISRLERHETNATKATIKALAYAFDMTPQEFLAAVSDKALAETP